MTAAAEVMAPKPSPAGRLSRAARPVNLSVYWKSLRSWRTVIGVERDTAAVMVARLVRDPDVGFVTVDEAA